MLRKSIAFGAAIALSASPVVAQSSAQPLSIQPSVQRAGAPGGASHLEGGNWFPPALFALIVIGGILMATGVLFDDDNDNVPFSP
jgi:hypothetical protein